MSIFDDGKLDRVADTVNKTNQQVEVIREQLKSPDKTIKNVEKKKVGRPEINEEDRKKSCAISMNQSLLKRLDHYREEEFPELSRSSLICNMLEQSLDNLDRE